MRESFRTVVRRRRKVLAEWFSLNERPAAERREIAKQLGEVIEYTIPRPDPARQRAVANTAWRGQGGG